MAIRKVEVSQETYLTQKAEILDNLFIERIDVNLSDLEVSDLKTIQITGLEGTATIHLTKEAINGLVESLGISRKFVDTLRISFGEDNKELLNLIIRKIKGTKVARLTLVYNKKMQEITNIYPAGTKLISDHQYFEALERVIANTPGAYLRNLTQTHAGDLKAVIANPNLEFQFAGKADECFTSGMTLDLDAHQMFTSFFTERLVCTNGCSTQNKLTSRSVNTSEKVPEFLTAILDSNYHINSVEAFKKRINRCYHTIASLREVLAVDRRMESLLGNYYAPLSRDMSVHGLKMVFGEDYLQDTFNHKFLRTNLTLWELVNEVTALSSKIEQHRIAVGEKTNLALQVIGGDLMFSIPDLSPSNIKQKF